MAQDDTGMVQRGLFLFAILGAIAVVTLFVTLYRPEPVLKPPPPTEYALTSVGVPTMGFPAALSWDAVYKVGSTLPSTPGWQVRYNATRALAHRGSARLPLDILAEMLNEEQQLRNNVEALNGKKYVDEASANIIVIGALKAVRAWHKHPEAVTAVGRDNPELQRVYAAVNRLRDSKNAVVQAEAANTWLEVAEKKG